MPDYRSKSWRWYGDDAAEPTTALANEDTLANPTTWAIKRLRCSIHAIRKYLYVIGGAVPGKITRVDLTDLSKTTLTLTGSISPTEGVIDNTNSLLWVWGSAGIRKIDLTTFTEVASWVLTDLRLYNAVKWVTFDSSGNVYVFDSGANGIIISKLDSNLTLIGSPLSYTYTETYPLGHFVCTREAANKIVFSAYIKSIEFAGAALLTLSDFTKGASIQPSSDYRTLFPGLNATYARGYNLSDGRYVYATYHNTSGSYHILSRIDTNTWGFDIFTAQRANETGVSMNGIAIDTTNDILYIPAVNGPDASGNDRIGKWSYANDQFTFLDEWISTDPLEQQTRYAVLDPTDKTQLYVSYYAGGGHDGIVPLDTDTMTSNGDDIVVGGSLSYAAAMGTNV